MPLTVFDMAVLFVICVSVLLALARGLVRETLLIGVWIAAAVIAWFTFGAVQPMAHAQVANDWMADGLTLAIVFVIPWVVLKILAAIVVGGLPSGVFGSIDHFLGAGYGLLRGAAVVSAAYLGLALVIDPAHHPDWVRDALLLPFVQDGALLLAEWAPEDILSAETWQDLPGMAGGLSETDFGARLFTPLNTPNQGTAAD